jgi:hypothetical protein
MALGFELIYCPIKITAENEKFNGGRISGEYFLCPFS